MIKAVVTLPDNIKGGSTFDETHHETFILTVYVILCLGFGMIYLFLDKAIIKLEAMVPTILGRLDHQTNTLNAVRMINRILCVALVVYALYYQCSE